MHVVYLYSVRSFIHVFMLYIFTCNSISISVRSNIIMSYIFILREYIHSSCCIPLNYGTLSSLPVGFLLLWYCFMYG